jgi:hypothetical protein
MIRGRAGGREREGSLLAWPFGEEKGPEIAAAAALTRRRRWWMTCGVGFPRPHASVTGGGVPAPRVDKVAGVVGCRRAAVSSSSAAR